MVNRLAGWGPQDGPILAFLAGCYGRAARLKEPGRLAAECKYFTVSYAGLVLLMPDMFEQHPDTQALGTGLLAKLLLEGEGVGVPFALDVLARYEHEDAFAELVEGTMAHVMQRFLEQRFLDPAGSLFAVLEHLLGCRALARQLPRMACWWPEGVAAAELGRRTFLGAIFAPAPDGRCMEGLLPMREQSAPGQVRAAHEAIQLGLEVYAAQVHAFLLAAIRADAGLKEAVIRFFADTAALNANRAKMHVDYRTVTPDGLVANMFLALLRLCEPFLGPGNPKAELIDPYYYETGGRLAIDQATKIGMEEAEYAEWRRTVPPAGRAPNFISDVFFLAVYFFRIGYVAQITLLASLHRSQRDLAEHLGGAREQAARLPAGPLRAMQELQLRRAGEQLRLVEDTLRTTEVYLGDPRLLESVYLLVCLMLAWMAKVSGARPDGTLPAEPAPRFRALPEYFVECVTDTVLFVSRAVPHFWVAGGRQLGDLAAFMVTFLDRSEHIRSPYIRSKFIEIMHGWTAKQAEHIFDLHPVMVTGLAGKMMRLYIEVERTGASSQFYDKFNIRFFISAIFQCLWGHPVYRDRIRAAAHDRGTFVQFINFLLNDTSYLLDEAMMRLQDIKTHQDDEASGALAALPEPERQARAESLRAAERQAHAYCQLGGSTLNMLSYMTTEIKEPFLQDEVVDHLAAMVDYNVLQLGGPKCSGLKVRHMERYEFEPRVWLRRLVDVFVNLSGKQRFLEALARDGRSFQPATMRSAAALLERHGLVPAQDLAVFTRLIDRVEAIQLADRLAEEDLGDIPDDFLDPLMATLMEDPVLLTTSGTTVDRKTIVAHLLNNKIDPFNRLPITMEQVVPNTALKARITQFLAERRKA